MFLMNVKTGLFMLKTANSRHEKWWETSDHNHGIFAVHVCLNVIKITLRVLNMSVDYEHSPVPAGQSVFWKCQ